MVALLVIVRLLTGGSQPEIELVQAGFQSTQSCQQLADKFNSVAKEPEISSKGKLVVSKEYQCILLHKTDIQEANSLLQSAE